eukprot:scaffold596_cov31-Phaeocystis_antarctica.AAC.1
MRGRGRGGVYALLLRRQCPLWPEQRSAAEQHERRSEDGAAQRVTEAARQQHCGVWRAPLGGACAAREAHILAVLRNFAGSDGGDAEAALRVLGHLAPEERVRVRRRPLGDVECGLPTPSHTQVELVAEVRLSCRLPVHSDRARGVEEQRGWAQHLGSAARLRQPPAQLRLTPSHQFTGRRGNVGARFSEFIMILWTCASASPRLLKRRPDLPRCLLRRAALPAMRSLDALDLMLAG